MSEPLTPEEREFQCGCPCHTDQSCEHCRGAARAAVPGEPRPASFDHEEWCPQRGNLTYACSCPAEPGDLAAALECLSYHDGPTCWTFALDGSDICINCRRNAKAALSRPAPEPPTHSHDHRTCGCEYPCSTIAGTMEGDHA